MCFSEQTLTHNDIQFEIFQIARNKTKIAQKIHSSKKNNEYYREMFCCINNIFLGN